ncbi:hypothetical protein Ciccas_004496 [Cichlidogyrus casuarinus]|uniref:Uncharacterized protein n=1 Tax=Cichlidogyrus casuarinus TaxID=1844966 RepID=A0ABD2QEU9_9PLAT
MQSVLAKSAPIHQDLQSKHPIHESCAAVNLETLEAILAFYPQHANVLKRGDWTPLMTLAASKQVSIDNSRAIKCMELLVTFNADLPLVNKDGWNCLQIAIKHNNIEMASWLLKQDSTLAENITKNGRTALHILCLDAKNENECLVLQKKLIIAYPEAVKRRDACGCVPFFEALKGGNVLLARELLPSHADVWELTDSCGKNALHICAETGQIDSLRMFPLIDLKLWKRKTHLGQTPLHLACKEGNDEIVEFILQNAEEDVVLEKDNKGRNALYYAAIGTAAQCEVARTERCHCLESIARFICSKNLIPIEELKEELRNLEATTESKYISQYLKLSPGCLLNV